MDLAGFALLQSPLGVTALESAAALQPCEADFLAHFQTLCRAYPAELARAALETAILRSEAAAKFPFAEKLFFTRQALEQASGWEIASYRAERYRGFEKLADLGCSIGSDTLALAQVAPTLGIDRDALRLRLAGANLRAMELEDQTRLVQAYLLNPLPFAGESGKMALYFDPARRSERGRAIHVGDYSPPLSTISSWLGHFPALGVKISPGVDLAELSAYDCEIEFISLKGELKEAVLWFGTLCSARRRATLLPEACSLATLAPDGIDQPRLPLNEPQGYLFEPDPAVLRAGLVQQVGESLGAAQLDPDIAYLTASQCEPTPFGRWWQVEDWFPFSLKRLRSYLRQREVGLVTVKKRGSPLSPEALIHKLRLAGSVERVVFLTHLNGKPIVIVAYPRSPTDAG